jgi:hypothetical protein
MGWKIKFILLMNVYGWQWLTMVEKIIVKAAEQQSGETLSSVTRQFLLVESHGRENLNNVAPLKQSTRKTLETIQQL